MDLNRNWRRRVKAGEPARECAALDHYSIRGRRRAAISSRARGCAAVLRHGIAKLRAVVIAGQTVNAGLVYAGRSVEPNPAAFSYIRTGWLARSK